MVYLWLHASTIALNSLYQYLWVVQDMCHGGLHTCHFVQPREQWRSAYFQWKTTHRADAEGRAFFCFCPRALLSSVMCVIARICSRCQGRWQTPDMKREDLAALSSFEGLNCLNTALLSKLLHCSKWPICVPSEDQLQGKLGTRQHFQKVPSWEMEQSTDDWHKNDVAWNKITILNHASVCPACRHFICLTCY